MEINVLSPREVFQCSSKDDAVIIDIRPEYETCYRVFDVPMVIFLPYNSEYKVLDSIPREKLLIVADSVGNKSKEFARFLLEQGFQKVAYMAGGIVEWDRNGLPLAKDVDYELNGGCACRLKPQKKQI